MRSPIAGMCAARADIAHAARHLIGGFASGFLMSPPDRGEQSCMGKYDSRPPWAEAIRNVARAGWPVLGPVVAALLGPALGVHGALARTAPALVVIAGSALLAPPRFAVLCVTTLLCSALTWTDGNGMRAMAVLLAEGVVTIPFVITGRAMWVSRRRAARTRLSTDSRFAVTVARGR